MIHNYRITRHSGSLSSFSCTANGQNRSSIGSVIVDLAVGGKILDIPAEPFYAQRSRYV